MSEVENKEGFSLVLSGGGIRAMVFHLGVLKYLSEQGLLESVKQISSVSGGSLIVGLILNQNKMIWPSSDDFQTKILPDLKEKLTSRSLQWGAVRALIKPCNWKYILSRANLLALTLQYEWNVLSKLKDLPSTPEWSINGTTAETGKRFRFKKENIGDYLLGYAKAGDFPLSNAMAVSAAFPGGFGPLVLDTSKYTWGKREWNEAIGSQKEIAQKYLKLHLYDGGVYDNLGLEPYFDLGKNTPKVEGVKLIVVDAGSPLKSGFDSFNIFRLIRIVDIMSDQSRSLRVRSFVNYLINNPKSGLYIYIKTQLKKPAPCTESIFASMYPTNLKKMNEENFDRIVNHGYQVAKNANENSISEIF